MQEQLSGWLGASQATPAFAFAKNSGTYQVRVRAEGRPGGCNKGWLTQVRQSRRARARRTA